MNETTIKTPGVYINEIPSFPPSVAQVATAIPAFIGYTAIAKKKTDGDLLMVPKRITSLVEFETYFGKAPDEDIAVVMEGDIVDNDPKVTITITPIKIVYMMHYAIRMYFANGGGPCYIVSVGGHASNIDDGDETKDLLGGLKLLEKEDEPTIIVFPDPVQSNVGSNQASDYHNVINAALAQCNKLGDRVTLIDVFKNFNLENDSSDDDDDQTNIDNLRNGVRSEKEFVMYGMAYHPWLETSMNYSYTDESVIIAHTNFGTGTDLSGTLKDIAETNSDYYNIIKTEINKLHVFLPPSSAIAGIYSRVDASRGVWKAPANESVIQVIKPEFLYSDSEQEDMNIHGTGKSINAIRSFSGKGTMVWGARTLAGNDNEWRYVNVRRFFNMVEESCKKASAQFVFEANDAKTWIKIRAMIENYLTLLWRQGALAGAKPEHAFFVKVGLGQTMTAIDILEGRLIVEVGLAAVRPAEFIILRFMHKMQES